MCRTNDPLPGSFVSPDTLVPDPGNVQAYNRYLYALGNPLKYNDPTGHCIWDLCIVEGVGLLEALAAASGTAGYYAYVASPNAVENRENAAAAINDLISDQGAYVTPATDVPGSIVLQDPVSYANQVQVTGTPLDSGGLPTIPPPSQPAGITTQSLVTPLPQQQPGNNIVTASHGHHPWPQYLGGPRNQPLLDLAPDLHGKFHAGLDKIFPRARGKVDWNSLTKAEQDDILSTVLTYSQDFDADYGTKTFDAVLTALQAVGITPP